MVLSGSITLGESMLFSLGSLDPCSMGEMLWLKRSAHLLCPLFCVLSITSMIALGGGGLKLVFLDHFQTIFHSYICQNIICF